MSWSELLSELLAAIAEKLTDLGDYLRFRCVCSKWRSATHSLHAPKIKIPWLILPSNPSSSLRHFYSFSEDRFYRFQVPDCARGSNLLCGSASGWLLASRIDNSYLHLINPFTPDADPVLSVFNSSTNLPRSNDINCMSWDWDLSTSWIAITTFVPNRDRGVKSITCCQSYFYILEDKVPVVQIYLEYHRMATIHPPFALTGVHILTADLAVSPDELFLLVRLDGCNLPYSHIFWLDRHKVAAGEKWTEVAGIGDRAIFIDFLHCFLVEAGGATGLKKNCVYSVHSIPSHHNPTLHNFFIQQFDFGDKSCQIVERKLSQYESDASTCTVEASWFMPNLECKHIRDNLARKLRVMTFL
ncbi:hypothetical protein LUZ61_013023 [Rhynchospora tenuis]|uniref:KIB1-4 beta-propeller domain-containing protein n=1 Tax=Rhynchospora tenuis TaxID=198213 RepID=A0AAD6F251_9POAL|nr:hypothetical protein LUZ61_013023 [Rhynchospora tenuis]